MKRQKTFYEILMASRADGRRERHAHPAPPHVARSAGPPPSVDAMALTPEDYRRRLAQLGLSLPADAQTSYRPMGANPVEDQRARDQSNRAVDRAGQATEAVSQRAAQERVDEIKPGSFDARTATPEQVRARYAQLGLDASPANVCVREGGRELEARTANDASHAAMAQRDRDREVARHAHAAIQKGERFDVRRLSAGEFAALMELRGGGGYEPVR